MKEPTQSRSLEQSMTIAKISLHSTLKGISRVLQNLLKYFNGAAI